MKFIYRIWWASLFIKLALSALLPLSFDESYYWVWSKNLQLSYFDHPPFVSWLFWLGHYLEPFGQAVRWPSVILGHLTLLIWIILLKPVLSVEKMRWWLWLALSSPLIGFGSLISTPDVPVVFFWSLSLYFLQILLEKKTLHSYFLLGVALGLGFCAKYHIVLFVPALLLYLTLEKIWYKVRWDGVAITTFSGLIFSLPVLIWNYQNHFKSFSFQVNHGLGSSTWDPVWTASYVFGQLFLIFPTVVWFALMAKPQKQISYLKYFAWLPLGFFFLSSFRAVVEANWPIVAYPAIFALALLSVKNMKALSWSVFSWGSVALIIIAQAFYPFIKNAPDKFNESRYFDPVKAIATQYRPLYLGSYQMAASLWYQYKKPFYKLFQISRLDFFDEIQKAPPSENHFFVIKEAWVSFPDWLAPSTYAIFKIKDLSPKFELYEVTKK